LEGGRDGGIQVTSPPRQSGRKATGLVGPFAFRLALNQARNSHNYWQRKLGQVRSPKSCTSTGTPSRTSTSA